MDAADFAILVGYLNRQRLVVDYLFISSSALVVYNWFITLDLEIDLIWCSKWGYMAYLFFLVRYLPLFQIYFLLYHQLFLESSPDHCQWTFPIVVFSVLFSILLSEAVLMLRTWAIWQRNKFIGVVLAILFVGTTAYTIVNNIQFMRDATYAPPPYPGFRGCLILISPARIVRDFYLLSVMDTVILVLMVTSGIRSYHRGDTSELSSIVYRDGVLFYFFLLAASATNVACLLALNADSKLIFTPFCSSLYSVLTSRIMFNIRDVGRKTVTRLQIEPRIYSAALQTYSPSLYSPQSADRSLLMKQKTTAPATLAFGSGERYYPWEDIELGTVQFGVAF